MNRMEDLASHIKEKVVMIVTHPKESDERKSTLNGILNNMTDKGDKNKVIELIPRVDKNVYTLIQYYKNSLSPPQNDDDDDDDDGIPPNYSEIFNEAKSEFKNHNDASKRIASDVMTTLTKNFSEIEPWFEAYEKNQTGGKKSRKHNKKTVKKNNKKRHTKKRRTGKRRTGKRRTGKRRGRK